MHRATFEFVDGLNQLKVFVAEPNSATLSVSSEAGFLDFFFQFFAGIFAGLFHGQRLSFSSPCPLPKCSSRSASTGAQGGEQMLPSSVSSTITSGTMPLAWMDLPDGGVVTRGSDLQACVWPERALTVCTEALAKGLRYP